MSSLLPFTADHFSEVTRLPLVLSILFGWFCVLGRCLLQVPDTFVGDATFGIMPCLSLQLVWFIDLLFLRISSVSCLLSVGMFWLVLFHKYCSFSYSSTDFPFFIFIFETHVHLLAKFQCIFILYCFLRLLVSYLYIRIEVITPSSSSSRKIWNNIGPKTDPWGTLDLRLDSFEVLFWLGPLAFFQRGI